ncbi:MAG: hypothetical protein HY912_14320 [Desulfomonile tiedjei]|uniref:DUF2059 domain-containing protein n=1 Tax=Desulfomonile tiedjei TaxID=2358 RepID=A0A9D6Z4L4_9BACT|nr:hypothetical protein [Desulfomonile tiedjei]
MRNSRNGLTTATFLLCLWLCGSLAFGDDSDALIDKAMRLSGMTGQIEMVGKSVLTAIPADAFPDQKARNEAETFIRRNASKEAVADLVRSAVREKFNRDNIEKVIQFYDSALGRKVGRLQENALETGLLKGIREGRKNAISLDETRLKAIKRIIDSENVSETNDILVTSVVRGLLTGSAEAGNAPDDESESIGSKLKAVQKSLAMEQHRMDDMVLTAYALTFRSLSDKELEELAAYHDTDAAIWFRDATINGLDRAVFSVSKALGAVLTASRNSGKSDQDSRASSAPGKRKIGRDE